MTDKGFQDKEEKDEMPRKSTGSGGAMVGNGKKPTVTGGLKTNKSTTYHGAMRGK